MAASPNPVRLADRYEVRQVLGQGGMGLVYRAYDTLIRREVAVKTLRDAPEPAALQLFQKECEVLASMSHPNIVEIFDIGELEEGTQKKPYFVMPLLPGQTLDELIRTASHRLTLSSTVEIIAQTCRGLQAAHERGLVHRDLKPSNIFVMQDDSVKVIDFGVAHMTDAHTTMGQKGTLLYMSPEQIEMKTLTPLSDIFSLSVVSYEALTGRHPFHRFSQEEIIRAILQQSPPPASEVNPSLSQAISRVLHKGMAKQPWHRFATAREFADTLQKAMRNEPIECFDPSRIQPRIQRATKAFEEGDFQFATEIIDELQAEGHLDSSITMLRQNLDRAVRQKTVQQLLESARARFEEEEDPLALQKIQEVLQIDSTNATALNLKSKIEQRRGDRQIDSWYKLAQQHIENHSFSHAREALQNVLDLRPKETRALQLLSDVGRQELDYKKIRQDKEQLHHAALEAWQGGDVSNALSKLSLLLELDRKAPDSSDSAHSATYQTFYNQVRSEHDAMNNGYAEARKQLGARNFSKALELCDTYIAKYPANALFQALKFDIEEQKRQDVSAYIANIDQQVEAEPDLDRRVSMLRDALASHPGEAHFERSLRLMEDKRDLVNSIVSRARVREEQGQFSEALGDWHIVQTIYSQYPGLKFELERLERRRDQQNRDANKGRWVEQVDSHIQSGQYDRALDLLVKASEEFPGDAELAELKKLSQEGLDRTKEVQRLISEGQELCSQQRFDGGIKLLRQAHELDEHSAVARAMLSDALVEQARSMMEQDWQGADALLRQALDVNPLHAQAKSMRTLVLDRKREEFISNCLSQARKLQAGGDVEAALNQVESGLGTYPQDLRLSQVRDSLRRELNQTQRRQSRRRDFDELVRLQHEAEQCADLATLTSLNTKAQSVAAPYVDDAELRAIAADLNTRTMALTGTFIPPAAAASKPPASSAQALANVPAQATETPAQPAAAAPVAKPPKPPARPQLKAAGPRKPGKMFWVGIALLFAAVLGFVFIRRGSHHAAAGLGTVHVHTTPAGATIRVNGEVKGVSNTDVELPAGSYEMEVALDGFKPVTRHIDAKSGSPVPLEVTLEPELSSLRIVTDQQGGSLAVDGQAPAQSEGGQFAVEHISFGHHDVKFTGEKGEATFALESQPAAVPKITNLTGGQKLHAVLVAGLGKSLRVYSSTVPAKVSVDGKEVGQVTENGFELNDLAAGAHQITVAIGDDQHTLNLDPLTVPTVLALVSADANVGGLLIATGEDGARVFINGKPYRESTVHGQLHIPTLDPGRYRITVSKKGFQEEPEQRVEVHKGEEAKVSFRLKPIPLVASLAIQGGVPGTEVVIDGASAGTVKPDGSLTVGNIKPGNHSLELRKERFKTKLLQKQFAANSTLTLSGADIALEQLRGKLHVTFAPPDANVTLERQGEASVRVSNGATVEVPPGPYTLTARKDQSVRTVPVEVVAGETRNIDLPAPGGMADWEGAPWKSERGWFVHKGGNFILFKTTPTNGVFTFTAGLRKGHRLQWVVNYMDGKNYLLYQMDENFFYRSRIRDGQEVDGYKAPHKSDKKAPHTFRVRVSGNEVTHEIQEGGSWTVLDKYNEPGNNLATGKFGFYTPGGDEVGLANFNHLPDLKVR